MGPAVVKEAKPTDDEEEGIKINHPRFSNHTIEKTKTGEEIIKIKQPIANEKEFIQWGSNLKTSPLNSEVNLFPRKYEFKREGYCGSSGFVDIEYDNFPFVLQDQIVNRQSLKQKYFQEPELWYLIYTLLAAGKQFHMKEEKVGDIRPQNIFINEDGQVKVANQYSFPSQFLNYEKTFYEKEITYLSPEELKEMQFGKTQPTSDPIFSESFSVGLTCLDAGTLTQSASLYLKNNKFDYKQLQNRIQSLQEIGYSQLLILVIDNLCEIDPHRRCTCSELFDWLKPYEEIIINLNLFQPDKIPQKLAISRNNTPSYQQPLINNQQLAFQNPPPIQPSPEKRPVSLSQGVSYQPPQTTPPLPYRAQTYEVGGKSDGQKIEFDLSKIDEQLEMSRKMFPS